MGTLRFFEEVVSFKIRRTFGFADYKRTGTFSDPVGGENEINDSTGPAGVRADFAVPLCRK